MVDYLLSENGAQIREQLSVQLVDQVDQLGVDAISFARKNVGQVRLAGTKLFSVVNTRECAAILAAGDMLHLDVLIILTAFHIYLVSPADL